MILIILCVNKETNASYGSFVLRLSMRKAASTEGAHKRGHCKSFTCNWLFEIRQKVPSYYSSQDFPLQHR